MNTIQPLAAAATLTALLLTAAALSNAQDSLEAEQKFSADLQVQIMELDIKYQRLIEDMQPLLLKEPGLYRTLPEQEV